MSGMVCVRMCTWFHSESKHRNVYYRMYNLYKKRSICHVLMYNNRSFNESYDGSYIYYFFLSPVVEMERNCLTGGDTGSNALMQLPYNVCVNNMNLSICLFIYLYIC